VALVRRCSFS